MTLNDLIPTLRATLAEPLESDCWPQGAVAVVGDVEIGGVPLTRLTAQHGTPMRVVAEDDVRARCRDHLAALPEAETVAGATAGSGHLCRAVLRWLRDEGLSLDVCSSRELSVALASGFPAARLLLHVSDSTSTDLEQAVRAGTGRLVLGSPAAAARAAAAAGRAGRQQRVLVRTEVSPHGDPRRALATVACVLGRPELKLVGLSCHLGPEVRDPQEYAAVLVGLVALLSRIRDAHGVELVQLEVGGGYATARPGDSPAGALDDVVRVLRRTLKRACADAGLVEPALVVQPGRALVARAGVSVVRVLDVLRVDGELVVTVDGLDQPAHPWEPAPARSARLIGRLSRGRRTRARLVSAFEPDGAAASPVALLPEDLQVGDLLAVPGTGDAGADDAPLLALSHGRARVVVRRSQVADLLARDLG